MPARPAAASGGHRVDVLVDRHRLAGQRRLLDAQGVRLDEAPVGGTRRAGLEQHEVAGHDSRAGDLRGVPSRTTRTVGVAIACSAAIAFSARYSWRKPIQAFSTTTTRITTASVTSPSTPDSTPAAASSSIGGDSSSPRTPRPPPPPPPPFRRPLPHDPRGGGLRAQTALHVGAEPFSDYGRRDRVFRDRRPIDDGHARAGQAALG